MPKPRLDRFAIIAALALAAGACSDSDTPTSTAPPTVPPTITAAPPETMDPTTTAALPSTGNAEIDLLLAASRNAEYHVVYDDGIGGILEIYRADGQLVLFSGGQALYQLADGTSAVCELSETPVCNSLPAEAGSLDATLSRLYGAFGAVLAGSESDSNPFGPDTELQDDTVAGRPARCASATTPTGAFAVCLDAEIGIVLSASGDSGTGGRSLEARKVEVGNVDPAIFELPAPILA